MAVPNFISVMLHSFSRAHSRYKKITKKVFGIVNSSTDFKFHHKIMDGCSDVIMEIFDKPVGYHARSAIGTNTLPLDTLVEVEAIVQIKPE